MQDHPVNSFVRGKWESEQLYECSKIVVFKRPAEKKYGLKQNILLDKNLLILETITSLFFST